MTGVLNFLIYQLGWFACVLGAAHQWPWFGTAIALSLVCTHMMLTTDRPESSSVAICRTVRWSLRRYAPADLGSLQLSERFDSRVVTTGLDVCSLDSVCNNISLLSFVVEWAVRLVLDRSSVLEHRWRLWAENDWVPSFSSLHASRIF